MKWLTIILSLCIPLQGCIFAVGAATGAAALAVVYDHNTLENSLKDQQITNTIAHKIKKNNSLQRNSHIEITTFHRIVLLTGQTPRLAWKQLAEEIAQSVPSITKVHNQIKVQGPVSTLTHASDAWITTKIKSQLLATTHLKSSSMQVVTESGVVYLMGIVTLEQADIAVSIARDVSGVQKVVRVFRIKH